LQIASEIRAKGDKIMSQVISNQQVSSKGSVKHQGRATTATLWTLQALLAFIFLFAGSMKLALPIEMLTAQMPLPGLLVRFIGVCEVAGALGLILPGLTRIQHKLTPLAACGLVVIMVGAVVLTAGSQGVAGAVVPFVVGVLAVFVASGRRSWAARA
jgi:uncharacterized membrane protein YphA (DoxX/SURF4 family)